MKNARGASLIEVLVSVAILSAIGAALMALTGQFGSLSTFYAAKEDYDNIYRATQLMLLNETMCTNALRDVSNNVIAFNPGTTANYVAPINSIYMINATNGSGSTLFSVGQAYTTRITISDIHLQEIVAQQGRGNVELPNGNTSPPLSTSYNTYLTQLNISVKATNGPPIGVKPIPITVAVDPNTQRIVSCYASTSNAAMCTVVNATWNPVTGQCMIPPCYAGMPSPPACPTPSDGNASNCSAPNYFLKFDATNQPVCSCVRSCPGPPGQQGAPGTNPAPAPAPAPYYPVYGGY